jgi:hypothetical protein
MREIDGQKIKQSFKKKICQIFSDNEKSAKLTELSRAAVGLGSYEEDRARFFPLFRILFVAPSLILRLYKKAEMTKGELTAFYMSITRRA